MKAPRNDSPPFLVDFDLGHDLKMPLGNLNTHNHDRIFRFVDSDRQGNRVLHETYTLLGE